MWWRPVLALVLLIRAATCCTVLELTGAGFAANAVHMLHAYTVFSQNNGTMYVNSTAFEYKCSNEGGWHDFFSFDGTNGTMANIASMPPGEHCAEYTFHDVDLMLHNMKYDWFSVDEAAAKKASPPCCLPFAPDSFLNSCHILASYTDIRASLASY